MRALIVESGKITNVIEVDQLSDVSGAVADDGGHIGWDYIDGKSVDPDPYVPDKALDARAHRDVKLQESDWTQTADKGGLSDSKVTEWATYRQALRDLPTSSGFPDSITWPTKPS